jgi:hypothetical protein
MKEALLAIEKDLPMPTRPSTKERHGIMPLLAFSPTGRVFGIPFPWQFGMPFATLHPQRGKNIARLGANIVKEEQGT